MIYVWADGNLDIFTSLDALSGYAEYLDVQNGLYEIAYTESGVPVDVETRPFDPSVLPRWRRALRLHPEREVIASVASDREANPAALAEVLENAVHAVDPVADPSDDLERLRVRVEEMWGTTR